MKIAINNGGSGRIAFGQEVFEMLGLTWDEYGYIDNEDLGVESDNIDQYRSHPALIEAINALGEKVAAGPGVKIKIVEIPDDVQWEILDYEGDEEVHERHRSWA